MWHPSLARALERPQGMRFYRDDFTTLSSVWQVVNGTLAVSGGGLRGATMADWLNQMLLNPGFETGDPPDHWTPVAGMVARAFAEARPGSAGVQSLEVERDGVAWRYAHQGVVGVVGATYQLTHWRRNIDGSVGVAVDVVPGYSPFYHSATAWGETVGTFVATAAALSVRCTLGADTNGQSGLFDDLAMYRRNAAAILGPWRSPNFIATLHHRSPAAGVVPWGWMFRRTNDLNYWELRVLPNTAGNDLQIVQVTAGVETVRAEADIDWTADGVDEIELSVIGTNITTAHRKSGAGVWTAGPSFSPATQGQTERGMGPLFYGTGQNRLDSVEVRVA